MKKINIPFQWNLDIPSCAEFTFQMDSERAGDEELEMEEFISFIVDLKTGEILWVHDYIQQGIAYPYESSDYIRLVGNGWYISDFETDLYPSDEVQIEIRKIFNWPSCLQNNSAYYNIVEQVCELGGKGEFEKELTAKYNELYKKHIVTEIP
jgi:hypothetical protein